MTGSMPQNARPLPATTFAHGKLAMSDKRANFEARDLSPPIDYDTDGKPTYKGPERRRHNRRSSKDRRGEVRFEPGKEDRRQKPGRRKDDKLPKFW